MKKFPFVLCMFLTATVAGYAQLCDIRFKKDTLDLGSVRTGETVETVARITNAGSENTEVLSVKFTEDVFKAEVSPALLAPGETRDVPISFKTDHNLEYNRVAFFRVRCGLSQYSIPLVLKANATYSDSVYNFTQNLSGEALKTALKNYVSGHTSLTYKDARTAMFSYIDNVNGEVECVYTGRKIEATGIPDISITKFNTEHTWPQSKGADDEPEKSDLNHIFPTDETANSRRASFGFGYVDNPCWEEGGSKLQCSTKFEPRDEHKGNVARAMFYFSIRYGNPFNYMSEQNQEIPLREWMKTDPVDAREIARNNEIEKLQKRRNPFIDHPEFVERIGSFSKFNNGSSIARLIGSDDTITIDVRGGSASAPAYVFLREGTQHKLGFELKTERQDIFSFKAGDSVVAPNGFLKIDISAANFSPTNQTAEFYYGGAFPSENGKITIIALQNPTNITEQNVFKTFTLQQNFPNPVESATTIRFTAQPHKTALKLYTLQGQEIFDATPFINWQEASGSVTLQKEFLKKFGNIVAYRLITPEGTAGKFMIVQ